MTRSNSSDINSNKKLSIYSSSSNMDELTIDNLVRKSKNSNKMSNTRPSQGKFKLFFVFSIIYI